MDNAKWSVGQETLLKCRIWVSGPFRDLHGTCPRRKSGAECPRRRGSGQESLLGGRTGFPWRRRSSRTVTRREQRYENQLDQQHEKGGGSCQECLEVRLTMSATSKPPPSYCSFHRRQSFLQSSPIFSNRSP